MHINQLKNNRQVAAWLLLGVAMIVVQVLLGGITRLTESGLSITEWKPITGMLPPLTEQDWLLEFNKYKSTDQFKYVHQHFGITDFKFIFFWEWFHRVWARLIGIVFVIGFTYFILKKKLSRTMIMPLVVLFILGGLQGAIGWIMVKSGLVPEKYFVGHVELTTHFIAALVLLSYTIWFAISLLPAFETKHINNTLKNFIYLLILICFLQLVYGGFMAGLKAAQSAPTWPYINKVFVPHNLHELQPCISNYINNPLTVQFMHRLIGYLFFIAGIIFFKISAGTEHVLLNRYRILFIALLFLQVILGITSLLTATGNYFIWFAAAHQFTAMLLVACLTCFAYLVRKPHR